MTIERFEFRIDVLQASRDQHVPIAEIVRQLQASAAAHDPVPFNFEGLDEIRNVRIKYVEFSDGRVAVDPSSEAVRICRVVVEDDAPRREDASAPESNPNA